MALSPLAGKPAPKAMLVDLAAAGTGLFRAPAGSGRSRPAGQLRHQRAPRHIAARHVQRGAHPGDHAGDLRLSARAGDRRARSTWARTRTRSRGRRSARRWRCWPPTASRPSSSATTASRRRRSSRTPSSSTTAGAAMRLADGIVITPSHNPPEDGGFKYNPPNGGPADTDVTEWIEDARQRAAPRRQCRASSGCRSQAAIRQPTTHQRRLHARPMSRTCATSSTWMPSAARS